MISISKSNAASLNVFLALLAMRYRSGKKTYATYKGLRLLLGLSYSAVRYAVTNAIADGLVEVNRKYRSYICVSEHAVLAFERETNND